MDQYPPQGNYGQQQQAPPPYPQQGQYGQQQAPPPYPQQGGYPPPGYPPQQPQRRKSWPRRHKVLTTLLAIVGLIIIISVGSAIGNGGNSGSTNTGTTSSGSGQQAAPAAAGPHIGEPAADGKFRFVVTHVSHTKSVGDTADGLGETADGRFTVLHIRVTNISNQSQTLDDSAQYVYDARGRKFDADTAADLDANPGNSGGVFLNDINPGNSVSGVILFDLPRSDKAVKAELHDSVFSGGVTIALTH
jgi:hypothetical protein